MDPSGNIYFTNCDVRLQRASQILKRTPQGQVSVLAGSDWGHADGKNDGAKFSLMGEAMAWGPDGSLYVTDGPTVRKVTLDGQVSTLATGLVVESTDKDPHRGTLYNHLMELAVDPSGNVYVADFGNRRVVKIRPDGKVATMARSGRLWSPVGVTFAAGELYVLEHL